MTAANCLLGRGKELRAVLGAVEAGAPLVVLTGDAGIGKSRLVTRAIEDARTLGATAMVGGCVALTGKLPLLPFVEAFAGESTSAVADSAAKLPASLRQALGALLPALPEARDGAASTGMDGTEDAAWERQRLFLAVAALLSPPARTSPTVVVLEDLHWADTFTLDLLTFLVAGTRTGATVIVTVRSDQRPVPESVLAVLGELQRLDSTVSVHLGPLDRNVVAQQIEQLLGATPPVDLVRRVWELGGGNPFFTEQLCRQVSAPRGSGTYVGGGLPPQLSGFLQSRLRGLSGPAHRVLLALGVAEVPLTMMEVAGACGLTLAATADAVRELSAAALLAHTGTARLTPRHALLAAAVTESSDPVTLATTHAGIARLLEAGADRRSAIAAAGHWAVAGREKEELRATLVAAPVAEELADFSAAASLWTRAYVLTGGIPDETAAEGYSLLKLAVAALRALNGAGRNDEAHRLAEDALERCAPVEQSSDGGSLRYWVGLLRSMRDLATGKDMLQEAHDILAVHGPVPDLVACLTRLGQLEETAGRPDVALQLLTRATEAAAQGGSLRDEAHATVAQGHLLFSVGRSAEAVAVLSELRRRPEVAADVRAQALLAVLESDVYLQTGELALARTVAWKAYETTIGQGHGGTWEASILRYNAAEAELELGHTSAAFDLVEAVTSGRTPDMDTTGDHLLRALADLSSGRTELAVDRVLQVRAVSRSTSFTEDIRVTAQGTATILRWAGSARRALDSVTDDLRVLAGTDQERRCGELLTCGAAAAADLITSARARGDVEALSAAEQDLTWLHQWLTDCRHDPFERLLEGGREPADGLQWAAERSRADGANDPALWGRAGQEWEDQGRPHRAAYCRWRMAQSQVDRGESSSSISTTLQRAYELSQEMLPQRAAIHDIAQRARVRLTTVPAAQEPHSIDLPVALTDREREILRHLSAGRSNTQIAHDLFISPKTVSVHVSNLLRKIGVTNRIQAAAWADRVGAGQGANGQGARGVPG